MIHSTVQVTCLFTSVTDERQAIYKGETGIGLGINLNWNKSETIAFAVFGASMDTGLDKHPLAGKYLGIKLGAKVLVGGGRNQFTL